MGHILVLKVGLIQIIGGISFYISLIGAFLPVIEIKVFLSVVVHAIKQVKLRHLIKRIHGNRVCICRRLSGLKCILVFHSGLNRERVVGKLCIDIAGNNLFIKRHVAAGIIGRNRNLRLISDRKYIPAVAKERNKIHHVIIIFIINTQTAIGALCRFGKQKSDITGCQICRLHFIPVEIVIFNYKSIRKKGRIKGRNHIIIRIDGIAADQIPLAAVCSRSHCFNRFPGCCFICGYILRIFCGSILCIIITVCSFRFCSF